MEDSAGPPPDPPRLTVNPYHEDPPDYTGEGEELVGIRAALMAVGNTPEEANQQILALWTASNLRRRAQWDEQVLRDQELVEHEQREREEERDLRGRMRKAEIEAEHEKKPDM